MKKTVITYGTFDLLHQGHINLLKRAKELGDYLIVGVTSDNYDIDRGKLNVRKTLIERIEDIRATGIADKIIIEEYEGQKIDDIQKYDVDIFTLGSDWLGMFDYLQDYCEVIYLDRTKGISSTQLRDASHSMIRIGIVGSGRIAHRFVPESKYVSGHNIVGVYNPNINSAKRFADTHELKFYTDNFDEFTESVDAVYIASPHPSHYDYIKQSLQAGKHVLCEKPIVLEKEQLDELYAFAREKNLILLEAVKTAFCPGFTHLMSLVKSGAIGRIKDVEATFTKLVAGDLRELKADMCGGAMTELGSYVLLPIVKLLGNGYEEINFISHNKNDVDIFTKGLLRYKNATASFKVGLGVKSEGCLIISGTKGYAYVPAPWWKTEYFELRYESQNDTKKYFYKFVGEGLRYELKEFIQLITGTQKCNHRFNETDSISIVEIIEKFLSKEEIKTID